MSRTMSCIDTDELYLCDRYLQNLPYVSGTVLEAGHTVSSQ